MWKLIATDTFDDRRSMETYEALIAGSLYVKTVFVYRNTDSTRSLCSDTVRVDEKRVNKKDK